MVQELSESISVSRFWGFCILSDFLTSFWGPGTPAKRSVSKNDAQRYFGNVLNRIQSRDFEGFVFYRILPSEAARFWSNIFILPGEVARIWSKNHDLFDANLRLRMYDLGNRHLIRPIQRKRGHGPRVGGWEPRAGARMTHDGVYTSKLPQIIQYRII